MTVEQRKVFEAELLSFLRENLKDIPDLNVLKTGIVINNSVGTARIGWRFLNKARGYQLTLSARNDALHSFFEKHKPPYNPNNHGDYDLVMTTSMEKSGFKQFSTHGVLLLPRYDEEIKQAILFIFDKLQTIYLPRVTNFLGNKMDTISDIRTFPLYYKYPFLSILFILIENDVRKESLQLDALFPNKVIGNKAFDMALLEDYLRK